MILKLLDEVQEDVLARDVLNNGTIFIGAGKNLEEDIVEKIRSINQSFVYVEGEPNEDQILRRYFIEIQHSIDEEFSESEKIEYIIKNNKDVKKIFDIFEYITQHDNREKLIEYCYNNYSLDVFNFFIKTVKMSDDSKLIQHLLEMIEKKITIKNIDAVLGFLNNNNVMIKGKGKSIIKKNFSLRDLYLIRRKNEHIDYIKAFFDKEINFSCMAPKHFWDVKLQIFTEDIKNHSMLKTYLENLEFEVNVSDYSDVIGNIIDFEPYIVFFDLDNNEYALDNFKNCSAMYKNKIYFIFSTSVDKTLFWETTNSGASYFIKKPYSLPKIQRYLTTVIQSGKLLNVFQDSAETVKIEVKNFGNKIKKIDFSGELSGKSVDDISDDLVYALGSEKFYFIDLINLNKMDVAGTRFLMRINDTVVEKGGTLYILNVTENIVEEFSMYKNNFNIAERWEDAIW